MEDSSRLLELTADIVAAHLSNNIVATSDVPNAIQGVFDALTKVGEPAAAVAPEKAQPKVSVRSSVKPDFIICLFDGKKQKMLKRHLQTAHGMTPREYRAEFGLNDDYPMVAPTYAETRRALAIKIGLGRKPGQGRGKQGAAAKAAKAASPAGRGRKAAVNHP